MKTKEAYTELSVQLARIEAKVDKILSVLVRADEVDTFAPDIIYTSDINRAKGEALNRLAKIYGVIEAEDSFNNPNPPKSILDAVDNPPPIFNAHVTETV